MTPEEQRLLGDLAQRVRSVPPQQKDPEAEEFLRRLAQERPETVYILAQTVIMQEFALKNAEAQMQDLQRQAAEASAPRQSGGFLGGLFGGGAQPQQPQARNPWGAPQQQGYGQQPPYQGGPAMQPQQQGGFLRNAATTAVGVAGGALLFSGISSMFGSDSAVTQAAAAANPEAAADAGESFPQSDYADNSGGGDDSWGFGDDGGDFA